jgi:CheY-like chemotaxis protein
MALEIVRGDAQMKDQVLSTDFHARRALLNADPARLQQVFWNLLRNAVKFTPRGGRITISTVDDEHSGLRIEVADTGVGMAPEAVGAIFEPFDQGGLENDHRYGGLGLGLTIVRAIVDLHGGSVEAQSLGIGEGSTFVIHLPGASERLEKSGNTETPPALDQLPGTVAEPPARGLRLLVVEDHEATLQIITKLLNRAGHQVVTANNVQSALEAAANRSFDAVISDLGLPDGTGYQLMEQLRSTHDLRGIAVSGYGMEDDRRRSKESGFIAHLTKPIDFSQLQAALNEL